MKVAVSAVEESMDAEIDPRFGRCQFFIIVETDSMEYEALPNTSAAASGGAGIEAAQSVANKGVEAVITGNVGLNAFNTLSASGIKIVTGVSGVVREAVERYRKGEWKETTSPTVGGHFGMGGG
jgi:predicted Fe-Mo cluster-binding NifX family protein